MLEHTKRFLSSEPDITNPLRLLADVLAASIELVSSDANDFAWSSWKDRNDANDELRALLEMARSGVVPKQSAVAILFAPTGPLQELSMGSGWAEQYLKLAQHYDVAERLLWPSSH
jgi:hypothetical protein